jgi:hypothetical protein
MVSGLDFDQRNWEIFGIFFARVNSTKFCYFFGKILQIFGYHWIGGKKKKKKPAIVFPLQLGHQFILFVEMLKFSPKKSFFIKKKKGICEGKKLENIWNPKEYFVFRHRIFKIKKLIIWQTCVEAVPVLLWHVIINK